MPLELWPNWFLTTAFPALERRLRPTRVAGPQTTATPGSRKSNLTHYETKINGVERGDTGQTSSLGRPRRHLRSYFSPPNTRRSFFPHRIGMAAAADGQRTSWILANNERCCHLLHLHNHCHLMGLGHLVRYAQQKKYYHLCHLSCSSSLLRKQLVDE